MIKKSIVILLSISMFIGIFGIGNVVAEAPKITYEIYNVYDLQNMSNDLDGNYILMNDIDASVTYTWEDVLNDVYGFKPIGKKFTHSIYETFTGNFYGQNYTISNLYINISDRYSGLIGYSEGVEIHNLNIENIEVINRQNYGYSGGIIGENNCEFLSTTNIENCHVSGIINGSGTTGGIIGFMGGTVIRNCSVNIKINSTGSFVGGIVGFMSSEYEHAIYDSYSSGNINCIKGGGGLVGIITGNDGDCEILRSYSSCNVYCNGGMSGGFIGQLTGKVIINILECYATGNATGNFDVGGFVGNMTGGEFLHTIQDCYSTGNAIRNNGEISEDIGGFIGSNNNHVIMNCYSIGEVIYEDTINPTDKGFSGRTYDLGQLATINCHWDMNTSNQISSGCDAEGNTTIEMKQQSTFIGWDFENVWYINENETYPYLQWQGLIIEESEEIGFADIIILLLISIMPVIIIVAIFKNIFGSIGKTMFEDGKKK